MKALVIYTADVDYNAEANFAKLKFTLESRGFTLVNVWYSDGTSVDPKILKDADLVILKGFDLSDQRYGRVVNIDNNYPDALRSDPSMPGELTHEQLERIDAAIKRIRLFNHLEQWRIAIFATLAGIALCIWGAIFIINYYR